jgi:DNA-binding CsgD family transcriptional regulator
MPEATRRKANVADRTPCVDDIHNAKYQNNGVCNVIHGAATVLVRHLLAPPAPSIALLIDLFGLTHAEAEVAVILAGGVSAEQVARERHVSLDTVRSQIRAISKKIDASGLRGFERIIALSSTMPVSTIRDSASGKTKTKDPERH